MDKIMPNLLIIDNCNTIYLLYVAHSMISKILKLYYINKLPL